MRPFILIALLATGIFAADTSVAASSGTPAPPACNSDEAKADMKAAIENGAFSNLVKVQLLDFDNLAEVSFVETEGFRECMADVVLNTGRETVSYTFSRAKSDPSNFLIEVEALDDSSARRWRADAAKHNETDEQKAQDAAQAASQERQRKEQYASQQQTEKAVEPKETASKREQTTTLQETIAAVKAAHDRKDYQTELKLLQPLADQGDVAALFLVGELHADGHGVKQDYVEAMKWFRKAADQGMAQAQYDIGIMYANGKGVPRDYIEAMKWLRKAADQGLPEGQYNVGVAYDEGLGVQHDDAEANKWFKMAAQQGNKDAQDKLAERSRDKTR
jgi:hypothetical protein